MKKSVNIQLILEPAGPNTMEVHWSGEKSLDIKEVRSAIHCLVQKLFSVDSWEELYAVGKPKPPTGAEVKNKPK